MKLPAPTISILLLLTGAILHSQGVYLGSGSRDARECSILELESSSAGFLMPRLSIPEIMLIANPAEGLMVFNTDKTTISYFNGTRWMDVTGDVAYYLVGDSLEGGIVIEVDGTGLNGKIAAFEDLEYGGNFAVEWGCYNTLLGASSTSDGASNTFIIVNNCAEPGIAARLCDNYSCTYESVVYDDWYLPAESELVSFQAAKDFFVGSLFPRYWGSTETNNKKAVTINMNNGSTGNRNKNQTCFVRPVRAF